APRQAGRAARVAVVPPEPARATPACWAAALGAPATTGPDGSRRAARCAERPRAVCRLTRAAAPVSSAAQVTRDVPAGSASPAARSAACRTEAEHVEGVMARPEAGVGGDLGESAVDGALDCPRQLHVADHAALLAHQMVMVTGQLLGKLVGRVAGRVD